MLKRWRGSAHWGTGVMFPGKSMPLHSMVSGCGHEVRATPDYSLNGEKRGKADIAIWQYTMEGEGSLEVEGRHCKIRPGEAMIVHVPQRHRYYLEKGAAPWEFIYVSMNGRELMRLWYEIERRFGNVVKLPEDSKCVATACEILSMAKSGTLKSPFLASWLSYKMAMGIFEDLGAGDKGRPPPPVFIRRVMDYCQENFPLDIDVDDMAEVSGYSRYHFSRLFHGSCGMSPAQFLRDVRLKNSVRMLQMESLTVKEIAARCGFDDESYFCKVFKKAYGSTPDAFRRGG